MLVRKKSGEKQENAYFRGVCHLSEQKCISKKIGMGAGLEIDWEPVKGGLCTKVLVSVCNFQRLSLWLLHVLLL